MSNKSKKIMLLSFGAMLGIVAVLGVAAAVYAQAPDLGLAPVEQTLGLPSTDIRIIVAKIIRAVLGLLGIIAVVMIIYGGVTWMTAGGDAEKIDTAKKILINAVIGLAIILSSVAITQFVIGRLIAATTGVEPGEGSGGSGGGSGSLSSIFFVKSLPPGGEICIKNVQPIVEFNRAVDITSLNGAIVVQKGAGGAEAAGKWRQGSKPTVAIFTPEGSCAPQAGNDCLEAKTQYVLHFKDAGKIRAVNSNLTLNCTVGDGCKDVAFTTGEGVDREPPRINIIYPTSAARLQAGTAVPLQFTFSDDNGVQQVAAYVGNNTIATQTFPGCRQNGTFSATWSTGELSPGQYTLEAVARDWAAAEGTDRETVTLRPAYCFNGVKDADETGVDCGGASCGTCAGGSCSSNEQCAGGLCSNGICVNQMSITAVSPASGAVGTFVTISGNYFGASPGKVYFAKNQPSPDPNQLSHWIEARPAQCGMPFDYWTDNQIVVEVPPGAVSGPIMVVTGDIKGADGVTRQFKDTTTAAPGPFIPDFRVTNEIRPGLCAAVPDSAFPGESQIIQLYGKNFGLLDNPTADYTAFGEARSIPSSWSDTLVNTTVPNSAAIGPVGVKVVTSDKGESNAVRFTVKGAARPDDPVVTSISPNAGAEGEYITITGKNFGTSPGRVWFKRTCTDTAILGDINFPTQCSLASTWKDDQIIIKFPKDKSAVGVTYQVQVNTSQNRTSPCDPQMNFRLRGGAPAPGICQIEPVSGPVPFPGGAAPLRVSGEYFLADASVAHYSFDAGTMNETAVKDLSRYGHTGTIIGGAGGVEGRYDQGLAFDGADDYVEVKDNNALDLAGQFTIAAWVYYENTDNIQTILSKDGAGVDTSGAYNVYIDPQDNSVRYEVNNVGGFNSPANVLRPAAWEHIVITFDQNARERVRLYVNGKTPVGGVSYVNNQPSLLVPPPAATATNLLLGRRGIGSYLKGRLDDVRLYNYALSPAAVMAIYTSPRQATNAYFWTAQASPAAITNRLAADQSDGFSVTDNLLTAYPPIGTISGPVVVYRGLDQKMSNPVNFSVYDCVKNNNTCGGSPAGVCCRTGAQTGMCVAAGTLCQGETRSSGYMWRFSTKDIPAVPRVVERCDATTEKGEALPSPSPSVQWQVSATTIDPHYNACRTALVTVEFSALMDSATVNGNSVAVNSCTDVKDNNCTGTSTKVDLDAGSFTLGRAGATGHYLQLKRANSQKWEPNTWYQVVFKKGIKSAGADAQPLEANRPCTADSAYCFVFKTGTEDCKMRAVVITPVSYFTTLLEEPMRERIDGKEQNLIYRGNGLSEQRCIMMDVSGFDWMWNAENKNDAVYAEIFEGKNTGQEVSVSSKANTVGVGLRHPDDAVDVKATAATIVNALTRTYDGTSPLKIDLSDPQVVDKWPTCPEACPNAEVGVRFNVSMSTRNIPAGVELRRCNDANCLSTTLVGQSADAVFDPASNYTVLKIANSLSGSQPLVPNATYQVVLSATTNDLSDPRLLWSQAKSSDPASSGKAMKQLYTWTFRTKATACTPHRVKVIPEVFATKFFNDRTVYQAELFSSPDACSTEGQKLNAWRENWGWTSSDTKVATVSTFSTQGNSAYCTARCIRAGSDLPAGSVLVSVCGNNRVEAGEDCDPPGKNAGCSLDCRWLGEATGAQCGNGTVERGEACDPADPATRIGCGTDCKKLGSGPFDANNPTASWCGSGTVQSGEDCDLAISGVVGNPQSALYCSEKCLHQGTRLSSAWCFQRRLDKGGFTSDDYTKACATASSQCGNRVADPDEDPGCDDASTGWNSAACTEYCLKKTDTECQPESEGCDENGRHVGSSLLYSTPSLCGDGTAGIGEDNICEARVGVRRIITDPWALAIGVGLQTQLVGDPPAQRSNITGRINLQLADSGEFVIMCGYKSDADCQNVFGADYGAGSNSCCSVRPKLTSTFPLNKATNVCRNTYLAAIFDQELDPATVAGNVIIAQGITAAVPPAACTGENDVTSLVGAAGLVTRWCAESNIGIPEVQVIPSGASTSTEVRLKLLKPLVKNRSYAVILKDGIRDAHGVSIGKNGARPWQWDFTTGEQICEVEKVSITPDQVYFSRAFDKNILQASAASGGRNSIVIQPIPGEYDWEYIWGPANDIVTLENVKTANNKATAQNRNGEVELRAAANVIANRYTNRNGIVATGRAKAIVFLCERPWPPKNLLLPNTSQPVTIFPYEDTETNNDDFDVSRDTFTNTAIPPSAFNPGYFNFSTYYCADNGATSEIDDWPYLRPAVQTAARDLAVSGGICEFTGADCSVDSDCGQKYTVQGVSFGTAAATVCAGATSTAPTTRYFLNNDGNPLECSSTADCTADTVFNTWLQGAHLQAACVSPTGSGEPLLCHQQRPLKRFFFTNSNTDNRDVIGIQIFDNRKHLSAVEWYRADKARGGRGFVGAVQTTKVDGYDAASDGNNIYVDVFNYDKPSERVETFMYVFSINSDARPETRRVFEEFMKNLRFNANLTNYGYCGKDSWNPDSSVKCSTDFDCPGGQICSAQADKLKRNYQRLKDFHILGTLLEEYATAHSGGYPGLKGGTYLRGQTVSTWPSWSVLGNEVGEAVPEDPVNKLSTAGTCSKTVNQFCISDSQCPATEKCILHDPLTGWSTVDRRFSFACATTSLAYRYRYDNNSGDYTIRARMEEPGTPVDLQLFHNDFLSGYINASRIIFNDWNGICNQDQEIATASQGRCGDRVVNTASGEQCDPPGGVQYGTCSADRLNQIKVEVCTSQCQWTPSSTPYISCSTLSKCGNGIVEAGELCDDGVRNGRYGSCDKPGQVPDDPATPLNEALGCRSFASAGICGDGVKQTRELCEVAVRKDPVTGSVYSGQCGAGANWGEPCSSDADCNSVSSGACQPLTVTQAKYGQGKIDSCNFDCQSYGPYCGDGIVQAQFGEECEASSACPLGGQSGKRLCGLCRWVDAEAVGWWRMDDIYDLTQGGSLLGAYQPVSVSNLSLYYSFDGLSGNVSSVSDLSGNNNNVKANGTLSTAAGKLGKSLVFDGASYLTAPDSNSLDLGGKFTIAFWMKPKPSSKQQTIISKDGVGTDTGGAYNIYLRPNLNLAYETNNQGTINTPAKAFPAWDEWHHVAMAFDDSAAAKVTFYIDGQPVPGLTGSTVAPVANQRELLIGRRGAPGGGDSNFDGEMDEVRIYQRVLSPSEIQDVRKIFRGQIPDALVQGKDGYCDGGACPAFTASGKRAGALEFNGVSNFATVPHQASLMPTESLSVEAWVKLASAPGARTTIVEKGGWDSRDSSGKRGGYSLNFLHGNGLITFAVFRDGGSNRNFRIASSRPLPLNTWAQVVGTYERSGDYQTIKLYIDGEEDKEARVSFVDNKDETTDLVDSDGKATTHTVSGQTDFLTGSAANLSIGRRSARDSGFFPGALDEIKIYPRALAPAEVKDHFENAWICRVEKPAELALTPPGTCGDGKVNEGEACDAGPLNDAVCQPQYGKSCTYCANNCTELIDKRSEEFCGNGIVEAQEACDADRTTSNIYAAVASDATQSTKDGQHKGYLVKSCSDPSLQKTGGYNKGARSCVNNCQTLQSNCIFCGLAESGGVKVAGNIINVLIPTAAYPLDSADPVAGSNRVGLGLLISPTNDLSDANRLVGLSGRLVRSGDLPSYQEFATKEYKLFNSYLLSDIGEAQISPNSQCSFGDSPNYRLFTLVGGINGSFDTTHTFAFSKGITASPAPAQYDLALSPVINQNSRPHDLRVVVKWIGSADINAGFYTASTPPTVENTSFSGAIAAGMNYYTKPAQNGIWYHGDGATAGGLHTYSFTVDTSRMTEDGDFYFFYVKSNDASVPISRFRSNNVSVEVYLPEDVTAASRFVRPVATFNLADADPLGNPSATYWKAFMFGKTTSDSQDIIKSGSIFNVSALHTGVSSF